MILDVKWEPDPAQFFNDPLEDRKYYLFIHSNMIIKQTYDIPAICIFYNGQCWDKDLVFLQLSQYEKMPWTQLHMESSNHIKARTENKND